MPKRSISMIKNVATLFAAVALFGILVYVGMRVFQPVEVPPPPPPKAPVTFDPEAGVRSNPLFEALKAFVTGKVDLGPVGNPNPFMAGGAGAQLSPGQASRLATAEELTMYAIVKDLVRGTDGSMLTLLYGVTESGIVYEIRSYPPEGEATTLATWTAIDRADLRVARIAQDQSGRVWMMNDEGGIGYVEPDGNPRWLTAVETYLEGAHAMVVDGADRLWITDGSTVSYGGERAFTSLSLMEEMTTEDQITLNTQVAALSDDVRPVPVEGLDGLIRAALLPELFHLLSDGRVALTTGYTAFTFPLSLQSRPTWHDLLEESVLPLAFAPNGDIWGVRYTDDALMRVWATGTEEYTSETSVPQQVKVNPALFGASEDKLYTVDYTTSAPYLWTTAGETWSVQVVVASGTLPNDTPMKVAVDGIGNVWMLMKQGGVVRITHGVSPEFYQERGL